MFQSQNDLLIGLHKVFKEINGEHNLVLQATK